MLTTAELADTSTAVERQHRRPALDGLRAVAITLVVCVHAFGRPSGGYLGVDLFFVLSGFLITRILLEEHDRLGRISLRSFYARRARRLLPGLVAMLAVYSVVAASVGEHPLVPTLEGLLYCTNFFVAFGGETSPVNHLWSLAAEEQFYFVWPLALVALLRFRRQWVVPTLLGILGAAAVYEVVLTVGGANGVRLDYGPDTRADGLIAGCLLAACWSKRKRPRVRLAAVAATPVIVLCLIKLQPTTPALHLGILTLIALYFAALVQIATEDGMFARVLAASPVAYLGRISYSLYLWHLPIIVALGAATASVGVGIAAVAISLVAAAASYHFIEQPFLRNRKRGPTAVRQPGLSVKAVLEDPSQAVVRP
ncbi:MAG TPA: acyltransferase [Gaiellaceae bacterium]|nr:acyltransferase [Gaiellaceae bacterium]